MPTNFWSFVYIIVKGSWAKVGSDTSTSLKMTGLQSRDITTNFDSRTLDNNINKWPKVGRHDWPPWMISDNFKNAILLCLLYGVSGNMSKGVTYYFRIFKYRKFI